MADRKDDTPVVSLDDHRIRVEKEFEDEQVLYVEALWGRETFAYNVAIRDIERMRRGMEAPGKPLRPPETHYEVELVIQHLRWLANEFARVAGSTDLVRPEDDVVVADSQ